MMKSHRGRHLRGFAPARDPPRGAKRFLGARAVASSGAGVTQHRLLLGVPRGVAVDATGNVYAPDSNNDDIRRISPD